MRRRRPPRLGRIVAKVMGASAALTRWERRHPFLSGIVTAPAIALLVIVAATCLHAWFGV